MGLSLIIFSSFCTGTLGCNMLGWRGDLDLDLSFPVDHWMRHFFQWRKKFDGIGDRLYSQRNMVRREGGWRDLSVDGWMDG